MRKLNLERLFLAFLAVSPLLDLAYGLQVYLLNGGAGLLGSHQMAVLPAVSVGLVVRMALLAVMAVYLVMTKDKQAILAGAAVAGAFLISVLGEVLRGNPFSLKEDVAYIARYSFNIAVFFVYARVIAGLPGKTARKKLDALFCWTLLAASLGVLAPYLCDIGFYTYADPMGLRGCRGLFFSGNDAVALMMVLLPVILCGILELDNLRSLRSCAYLLTASCGVSAMLVLGTKSTFLSIGVTLVGAALYAAIYGVKQRDAVYISRFGVFLLVFAVFFGVISLISGNKIGRSIYASFIFTGEYIEVSGVETAILSGRTMKLIMAWHRFQAALPWSAVTGLGRGTQAVVIEMDVAEMFLYYGIPGGLLMGWTYLKNGVLFLKGLTRRFTLSGWCCALALLLCCGYLFAAGHTLFSVTSGFYFVLILLYARFFTGPESLSTEEASS